MSTRNGAHALLDRYNALAVADHMVLQALSILYEPAAATLVSSCLAGAGCRESPLRAFNPQNVATRLARLTKAGFAADQTIENRGQKTRLWRCKPEAAEIAVRHAVRDGRFLPMAKAALTETRGRDWRGAGSEDSPRRRFRLAFHAGDWRLADRELPAVSEGEPGRGGLLLASLVRLQPDDSWRRAAKPALFAPVLAAAYRDLFAGLGDPSPLDDIARETLDKSEPPVREDLAFALVESLTLRGRLRDATKIAQTVDPDARSAALVIPALAEGRADAAELAETALARRRARLGARDALPNDGNAVWQILAVMSGDDPDAVETMLRRLSSPGAQANPLSGALSSLRHALLFMAGQASAARSLADAPPDSHPLTLLSHALAMLRVDPQRMAGL
ncbi:MAG: hypothetical protein LBS30_07255, partial [Planctomycetota bacterium]|nr:hypothetical protein [Planctomycetota bacterium]